MLAQNNLKRLGMLDEQPIIAVPSTDTVMYNSGKFHGKKNTGKWNVKEPCLNFFSSKTCTLERRSYSYNFKDLYDTVMMFHSNRSNGPRDS